MQFSQRLFLFIPVLFGTGIALYFSQQSETTYALPATLFSLVLLITCILLKHKAPVLTLCCTSIALILGGWGYAGWRAAQIQHPVIQAGAGKIWIRATVDKLELRREGHRMILRDLDLWQPDTKRWPAEKTPQKIRITIRTPIADGITSGSRIAVQAILSPPPTYPAIPGGYDFARYAYFQEIGGVGFSVSPVTHYNDPQFSRGITEHFWQAAAAWRASVIEHIRRHYGEDTAVGELTVGILTGDTGAMPDALITSMRNVGLGHLLAVSGLNMALVMSGAFFCIRFFFSLIPAFALRYPTKKIAAFGGIIVGFGYLLLTDMSVSAERSYMMVTLFMLAIMVDRLTSPMRPVALAAILILLLWPDSVINPSFQMSFAAVVALIATFQQWQPQRAGHTKPRSLAYMAWLWCVGMALSTFIAGLATLPYALYHFGKMANYSLLANLLGVPLTSFWVMPLSFLAVLVMPLGWEGPLLTATGWGNQLLIDWANWIITLPHPVTLWPQPPMLAVTLCTLGGLWLCLWYGKWRLASLPVILAGTIVLFLPRQLPDILVSDNGKLYALRTSTDELAFSNLQSARFARSEWLESTGQSTVTKLKDISDPAITCTKSQCYYARDGFVTLLQSAPLYPPECDYLTFIQPDIIFYLPDAPWPCATPPETQLIDLPALRNQGTHSVTFSHGDALFHTAKDAIGERYWTRR